MKIDARQMLEDLAGAHSAFTEEQGHLPQTWRQDRWEGARLALSIIIGCFSEEEAEKHWDKLLGRNL